MKRAPTRVAERRCGVAINRTDILLRTPLAVNAALDKVARLDRIVSTSVMRPWLRVRGAGPILQIPMLMYHSVSADLDSGRSPYFRTVTSPRTFAAHLRVLSSERFQVVTLSE